MEGKYIDELLYNAALQGDDKAVFKYLSFGANINSTHTDLEVTPLFAAISYNHTNTVQVLLDNYANYELPTKNNILPLYKAAHSCHSDITSILLRVGADKDKLSNGISPLYAAISSRCVKDSNILLESGASIHYDSINNPLVLASYLPDSNESNNPKDILKSKIIYELVSKKYFQWLDNNLSEITKNLKIDNSKTFEVVVVRYKESLSWIAKEYPNEKVIIYNKGQDDLGEIPSNWEVIKTPNVGWFGGTIVMHLANEYYALADRTVFLQGNPYAQHVPLPLINLKSEIISPCNNIYAQCVETTLKKQSDDMSSIDPEDWARSKYGGCFTLPNSTMIEFFKEEIDSDINPDDILPMVWGAQFAVDKEKVWRHHQKYYQKFLSQFNDKCPIKDFFMEKGWNAIFNQASEKLNLRLQEAAWGGDNDVVIKALEDGADINSKYLNKSTSLFLAVKNNKPEAVNLLIKLRADVNIPLLNSESPIWQAAYYCYPEIGKLLIEAGADIFYSHEYTPLYTAISEGCLDMVRLLLEAGADALYEEKGGELQTPILIASFRKDNNKEEKYHQIHDLVKNHYYKWLNSSYNDILANIDIDNSKTFEVVIVRYKEDLSWVEKEFPYDKVTIYNKGPDDLENLPANCKVIKVPNVGYLGGTYFKHIVDNYDNLADRTLLLQGDPYDAKVELPFINYKGNKIKSTCKNIIGKCVNTTLAEASEYLRIWFKVVLPNSKYADAEVPDYEMIEYVHNKIDSGLPLYESMKFVWGAEFAVDKEKIYISSKEKYAGFLPLFNHPKAGADFFQEQSWDILFQNTTTTLNNLLSNAIQGKNIEEIVKLIELGANAAIIDL